jgi:glycine hydroxymethyltransferase
MGPNEMKTLATWIDRVVAAPTDEGLLAKIAGEVKELCAKFPAPGLRI